MPGTGTRGQTVETVVIPQVEFLDKVVGRPRVAQRQALMVQTVRAVPVHTALKTMEDQQLQFFGELVEGTTRAVHLDGRDDQQLVVMRNGSGTFIAMMKVWVMTMIVVMEISATEEIHEVVWWRRVRWEGGSEPRFAFSKFSRGGLWTYISIFVERCLKTTTTTTNHNNNTTTAPQQHTNNTPTTHQQHTQTYHQHTNNIPTITITTTTTTANNTQRTTHNKQRTTHNKHNHNNQQQPQQPPPRLADLTYRWGSVSSQVLTFFGGFGW